MNEELKRALASIDWFQVVANHGPPCFHIENGAFCMRAERWGGHENMHRYVSLEELFQRETKAEERWTGTMTDALKQAMDTDLERFKEQNAMLIARSERFELALLRLRDGVNAPDVHCDPLPTSSSWRYVVDRALEKDV